MARPTDVIHGIDEQRQSIGRDAAIAALARRQHGVVSRGQLAELGLGRGAIDWRLAEERLLQVHRSVYAVGHRALAQRSWWMAAVLAAGPGAALSHRSAAALWDLRRGGPSRIEVSVGRQRRPRSGITVHHVPLPPDETTVVDGIPVTTVARTLLDLAGVLPQPQLERAIERAEALRYADSPSLDALLHRYPTRPGTRTLRQIRARGITPTFTRSELEDRFLAFADAHGLPRPETNVWLGDIEVDFLWRAERLIVELDGRETHLTAAAFERDRARDRALQAAGWRVVRITWRQLHEEAGALAKDLARLLHSPLASLLDA
jgi:predicted transcriptional regulator of viral defense system